MAAMRRAYVPQLMNIHMPASQEYPGGRNVQLQPGWVELDEEMQAHPILSRLLEDDSLPGETERQEQLRDAAKARDDAINEANRVYTETSNKIAAERREAIESAGSEYEDRRQEAVDKGLSFNEPHPDLDTRHAIALTAGPAFATPAASYAQPAVKNDSAATELPTTEENMNKMRRVTLAEQQAGEAKTQTASQEKPEDHKSDSRLGTVKPGERDNRVRTKD